jgi:hypothetical protein
MAVKSPYRILEPPFPWVILQVVLLFCIGLRTKHCLVGRNVLSLTCPPRLDSYELESVPLSESLTDLSAILFKQCHQVLVPGRRQVFCTLRVSCLHD